MGAVILCYIVVLWFLVLVSKTFSGIIRKFYVRVPHQRKLACMFDTALLADCHLREHRNDGSDGRYRDDHSPFITLNGFTQINRIARL